MIHEHRRLCRARAERLANGVQVHEIGMFVRSSEQFDRAQAAAKAAGVLSAVLDEHVEIKPGRVSLSTMHLAQVAQP